MKIETRVLLSDFMVTLHENNGYLITLESQKALRADITNRFSFIFMACLNEPVADTYKHMLLLHLS